MLGCSLARHRHRLHPQPFFFKKGSVEGFAAGVKLGARATSNRMACPGACCSGEKLVSFWWILKKNNAHLHVLTWVYIYIYVLNLAIKEYPQMIMYVQKIYGTSAVVCLAYVSFHLGSTRASWRGRDWASFLGFPTCSRALFVRGSVWTTKEQKCANKIPRQQLLGCLASSTFDGRWHIGPHPANTGTAFVVQRIIPAEFVATIVGHNGQG